MNNKLTGMAGMPPTMMKPAMPISPYPTFPRKREKGQSNRCASHTLTVALLATGLLAACAAGPDYQQPKMELPENWSTKNRAIGDGSAGAGAMKQGELQQGASAPVAAPTVATQTTSHAGERWWSLYADPVLDKLEDEAKAHNADAQVAVARVLAARAQLGLSEADQYPALSANAKDSRTRVTAAGASPLPATVPRTQNDIRATLDASYELDLWGKFRRASEASRAELLSAEASRDAAYLSLSAQVAQQYFALLAYDAQEVVLRRALAGRQEMIALDKKRVEVGVLSAYDMHQAEADEAAIRSQLAALAQARDKQEAALVLLLGRSPREVMNSVVDRGTLAQAPVLALANVWVPDGLPADLLLRRPDLQAAEQHLVSLNARIGAARAQYFPSLTLTSYLGSESAALSNLFTGPAGIFQFAAGISQPIFNAGRVGYMVDAAAANRDLALAQYRQAVASAFADVRNALSAQAAARQILDAETARTAALSQADKQAEIRYKVGLSSRLEVLDVERNYLLAELNRVDAQRAQRAAVADLFKALGGGWTPASDTQKTGMAKPVEQR